MNPNPCKIRTPLNNTTKVLVFFETANFLSTNYATETICLKRVWLFDYQNNRVVLCIKIEKGIWLVNLLIFFNKSCVKTFTVRNIFLHLHRICSFLGMNTCVPTI